MSYVIFLAICAIWGSSFILMDRAVAVFPPTAVAFWRVAAGAAVLGMVALAQRQSVKVPRRTWGHLFFVGGIAYACSYVVQPFVIDQGFGHGLMGMMVVFVPLATIAASVPMLGIRPTVRQLAGVVGGLVCFAMIAVETEQRGISTTLIVLAITVPVSYAFANTYVKRFLEGTPAVPLTFWSLLAAATTMFLASSLSDPAGLIGRPNENDTRVWLTAVGSVTLLGVFSTGIAMLLFNHLLIRHGPLFAGMVTYVVPMGAVLLGRVDQEPVTPLQIAALGTALAMVALVQYRAAVGVPRKPVVQPPGIAENE